MAVLSVRTDGDKTYSCAARMRVYLVCSYNVFRTCTVNQFQGRESMRLGVLPRLFLLVFILGYIHRDP